MNTQAGLVTLGDLVAAVRQQRSGAFGQAWLGHEGPSETPAIVVRGAHRGAGASTVAVALAEILGHLEEVTLVDLAKPGEPGASEALEVRADLGLRGYMGGRRGSVRIARPVETPTEADGLPGTILLDAAESSWSRDADIVVCRATVPSVRRAELLVEQIHPLAVAVVGASKWPASVRASLGPAMRAAWAVGGVTFFPRDSRLEINGLSAEPLPAATLRAGRHLLDFLRHKEPIGELP